MTYKFKISFLSHLSAQSGALLVVALTLFLFTLPALAVAQKNPEDVKLPPSVQPLPPDTFPNVQNNIDYKSGQTPQATVEPSGNGETSASEPASDVSPDGLSPEGVARQKFSWPAWLLWLLGIVGVGSVAGYVGWLVYKEA